MAAYAANTSVPVDRSRSEIEILLTRYGASEFGYTGSVGRAIIGFRVQSSEGVPMVVRIILPLPTLEENANATAQTKHGQHCRSLWRSLVLVVKAKLEAVSSGISTIEREFMPDIVMANGKTVGQAFREQLPAMTTDRKTPLLLSA